MTDAPQEAQNGPQDAPAAPEGAPTPETAPEGQETAPEGQETAPEDGQTFPAAVVKELRDENAKLRVKSKRTDDLAQRLVTTMAAQTGRLADATDLPYTDELLDEEGYPDSGKVQAAVEELLKTKPHLASRRPSGDVGQGPREEGESFSLASLLRGGA